MGTVALGLGQIGAALEQAKAAKREEALKQLQEQISQGYLKTQQQQLELAKQKAVRPNYVGMEKVGNTVALFTQNPDGSIAMQQYPLGPGMDGYYEAGKRAIDGIFDPMIKKEAQDEFSLAVTMGDTKGGYAAVKDRINRAQMERAQRAQQARSEKFSQGQQGRSEEFSKEQQVRSFENAKELARMRGTTGGGGDEEVDAYVEDLMNRRITITQVPTKVRGKVLASIQAGGDMPPRALQPMEQRLLDSINTIEPTLDTLEGIIKSAKLEKDNSPIAPRVEWVKYKYLKIAPEGARGELIRNSAALQVMGAAPWIQIGRGKYLFETISNHLPNPEDSPKLLMDKIKFLRRIMADSKKSLGVEEGEGNADPLGVLNAR